MLSYGQVVFEDIRFLNLQQDLDCALLDGVNLPLQKSHSGNPKNYFIVALLSSVHSFMWALRI